MSNRFYLNKLAKHATINGRHVESVETPGSMRNNITSMAAATLRHVATGENQVSQGKHTDQVNGHLKIKEIPFKLPGKVYLDLKRGLDVAISLVAMGVFGLILPLLALIIKLDSPGPIFYSQDRVGINRRRSNRRCAERGKNDRRRVLQPGTPFRVHKLRTMGVNAEASGPQWASQNDVRVTRVGRFLRKTRLDEVPQFLNVLKGEMSLIGPRPERLVFVRKLENDIPEYHDRLLVLPGITGLAQVINGYDDSLDSVRRKVELDRRYIRNAGFLEDSKIIFSTVGVVLKGEGAR